MNIQKFVSNTPSDDIFHSSAYAKVAAAGKMGATNAQSFRDRYKVDRNRRAVGRYADSHMGRVVSSESAKEALAGNSSLAQPENETGTANRQRFNAGATPPRGAIQPGTRQPFREPPTRGFNPYA